MPTIRLHLPMGAARVPRMAVMTDTSVYDALSVQCRRVVNDALSEKSKRCVVGLQVTKDRVRRLYLFPDRPETLMQFRQLRDGKLKQLRF